MGTTIPRSESKFYEWSTVTFPYATSTANVQRWGLADDAVSPELKTAYTAYTTAYLTAENPVTRTPAAIQAKNEARQVFEKFFRAYIRAWITNNPHVTDEDRRNMRLPIHDTIPTAAGPPGEMPLPEIDFSKRQQHSVFPKNAEGKHKKPENAHGYEVYSKMGGDAPVTDSDFTYAGFSTRAPFIIKYNLEDTGKTVWYRVRWVNRKNDPGPWSEIVTAVIG
jgi:hypothetical protein